MLLSTGISFASGVAFALGICAWFRRRDERRDDSVSARAADRVPPGKANQGSPEEARDPRKPKTARAMADLVEEYEVLLDTLPVYFYIEDADDGFKHIKCNRVCSDLWDRPLEEVIGKSDEDLFGDTEEVRRFRETDILAMQSGSIREDILPFTRKNGSRRIGHFYRRGATLPGGRHWLLGLVVDITERETAKQRAEENAEWLRLTLNSIGDGVIATDQKGIVTLLNPVAERLTGVNAPSAIGKPHERIFNIVNAMDDFPMPSPVTRALRTGNTVELANHTDLVRSDGKRFHVADSAAPIRNEKNEITGAILVFRDVTEEYLQRDKLRDALNLWNLVLDTIPVMIFAKEVDNDYRYVISNRRFEEFLGRKREDVIGKSDAEIFSDANVVSHFRKWDEAIQAKGAAEDFEESPLDAQGHLLHLRTTKIPFTAADGRKLLVGVSVDLTRETENRNELEKVKTELEDTLAQHKFLLDNMPIYVYAEDVNDHFRHIYCNRICTRLFGRPTEEIIGKSDPELFGDAGEIRAFRKADEETIRDTELHESIMPFTGSDGRRRTGHFYRKCLALSGGRKWLFGLAVDITDSEALSVNQKILNDCFEAIVSDVGENAICSVLEKISRRIGASRCYLIRFDREARLLVPMREYLGVSGTFKAVETHPMSSDSRLYRELTANGIVCVPDVTEPAAIERFGLWKETNEKNGVRSIYAAPIRVGGGIWGYIGITFEDRPRELSEQEISFLKSGAHLTGLTLERRDANEKLLQTISKLKESGTLMAFGGELTKSSAFRLDLKTREVSGTPGLEQLLLIRNRKVVPFEEWLFPEDIVQTKREFTRLLDSDASQATLNFRSQFSGELRYYKLLLSRLNDDKNTLWGVIQDVSEITRTAARFKESQELWERIIHAIPMPISAKSEKDNLRYVLCNKAYADFFGKTVSEIVGKTDSDLFLSATEARQRQKNDREILRNGHQVVFEEDSTDKSGRIRRLRSMKMPFVGDNGNQLLIGLSNDITELSDMIRQEQVNGEVLSLALQETDFGKLLAHTLTAVGTMLRADRVCFFDGRFRFISDAHADAAEAATEFKIGRYQTLAKILFEKTGRTGMTVIPDIQAVPNVAACFVGNPIVSIVALPVFIGRVFEGALIGGFTQSGLVQSAGEKFLSGMVNIIALAIVRERQSQAVRQAEEEKRAILDNVSIPLLLFGPDGCIVRSNAASEARFGKIPSAPPFACRTVKHCEIPEADCPVRLALRDGKTHQILERWGNFEHLIEARPLADHEGRVTNVILSAVDISRQNRLIRNQQVINDCLSNMVRESDMRQAIELSLQGVCERVGADHCYIFQFDTAGKTISCFAEYDRHGHASMLEGYQKRPYSAKPDWEERFIHERMLSFPDLGENYVREGLDGWKSFIEKHGVKSLYAHRILLNGKFWGYIGLIFEQRSKALSAEASEFIGSIAHCVELMLIRMGFQVKILEALDRAKAADRAKSMFLASMSHEIRTPLNAVIGFTELLLDGTLTDTERSEYLSGISAAGNSLLALINDVLDLSKLEAGQMVLKPVAVDFSGLIGEVCSIFTQKCAEREIYLRADVPDGLPDVWIDKLRVRQILFNLIGNAVKFTDTGGIIVGVSFVPGADQKGTLSFHVIDTGCGIAPDDQKKLFQMFVQADSVRGTRVSQGGTGLGLAICRRLVEQMGGGIHLRSEPGKGSDFSVTLHHIAWEPHRKREEMSALSKRDACSSSRILLVDDVPMNLKVMSAMIKKLGMPVSLASNATEALAVLAKEPVDFVLTDLWMPGINGAELARQIRKNAAFNSVRIIAVTADTGSGDNFDMAIFDTVLTKPVTIDKVAALFARWNLGQSQEKGIKA